MATLRLSNGLPCSPGSKRWPCIFMMLAERNITAARSEAESRVFHCNACLPERMEYSISNFFA